MKDIKSLRPIQNFVLIEVDLADAKTAGGIIIPDNARQPLTRGLVIAAGPGKWDEHAHRFIETTVKAGDRVLYGKYSGNEFQGPDRKDYRLMREDDVYGVIEE